MWDPQRGDGVRQGEEQKVLIRADSRAAIVAARKAGRMGKARSRHLQKIVSEIAAGREGGEVKIGWVKGHMGMRLPMS